MLSAKSRSASDTGGGLAQEIDLVVEEQRLEMLLDAHQLVQALEREFAAVLAELADGGEEERARGRVADRLRLQDALDVDEARGHVRRP